ncbi:hypothetical protein SAMN02745857_02454 [Andreprevotia lacus DSM 23236]|uniref:DUF2510 domain-containing protein n=1 Tax=Andreprevotia lacus DSM 23236 TaxID=1121001 RepID=A0A1W1XS11_9NEIS|nr:hypothetical protein [Andreprevotia lacus]SMC26331.1 hypothetical protein SAMN02745857_02454 [Andreprevotia lacus DSM 23236]
MIRFYTVVAALLTSWLALAALKKRQGRPDAPLLRWPAYPLTDHNAARPRHPQQFWDKRDWVDAPFRRE